MLLSSCLSFLADHDTTLGAFHVKALFLVFQVPSSWLVMVFVVADLLTEVWEVLETLTVVLELVSAEVERERVEQAWVEQVLELVKVVFYLETLISWQEQEEGQTQRRVSCAQVSCTRI